MVDNLNKVEKKITISSFLTKFFLGIGLGAVFLSIGFVGTYRLLNNLSFFLAPALLVISLILGLLIDILMIRYFLKNREHVFTQLYKEDQ
ncbi:MAG: hypothetical protein JNM06_15395 [Blastocatellia bacterium]|nr:hypothetical protein [Blastocatellia bacterium]MBN8724833.1 hypothetical protein [Acidobacteriota bacterium]